MIANVPNPAGAGAVARNPCVRSERRVVISVVESDSYVNPYEMDYLKEGIGLRDVISDPLVEQ